MGLVAKLLGRSKANGPLLTREDSLNARPVVNQLVRVDEGADGNLMLNVPSKKTWLMGAASRLFRVPATKRIELDALGTYVIQHCDGTTTVAEIINSFARKFRVHRREAEVSMVTFLRALARKGVIGFAVDHEPGQKEH